LWGTNKYRDINRVSKKEHTSWHNHSCKWMKWFEDIENRRKNMKCFQRLLYLCIGANVEREIVMNNGSEGKRMNNHNVFSNEWN